MKILIAYGTLTMNTEMVASHLYDGLSDLEAEIDLINMIDITDPQMLTNYDLLFLATSSWGEGEYPPDTEEFDALLRTTELDLSGKKAAFIGLGDSSYEQYNGGIQLLSKLFLEDLKAKQVGETFLIDGFPDDEVLENVIEWGRTIVNL